jgi:hypothetical protein
VVEVERTMRPFHSVLALLLVASPLAGQRRSPSVAIGGGILFADNGDGSYLNRRGISAFLRLGWPLAPLVVETSFESVPRNTDILFAPCMPPPAPCAAVFLGPNTALTFAPALQLAQHAPAAAWLFRLGPSLSWLVDREPGSHPLAMGWRGGTSIRTGHKDSGFLLSVDYYHLFRHGTAPDWFLPITVGWEF